MLFFYGYNDFYHHTSDIFYIDHCTYLIEDKKNRELIIVETILYIEIQKLI